MRTPDAATLTGVTFRQLDYLTRNPQTAPLVPPETRGHGSGTRRNWHPTTITRIALAQHTVNAIPTWNGDQGTTFPHNAAATLTHQGPIPESGWLIYEPAGPYPLDFAADAFELAEGIHTCQAAVIVAYDLYSLFSGNVKAAGQDPAVWYLAQIIREGCGPASAATSGAEWANLVSA